MELTSLLAVTGGLIIGVLTGLYILRQRKIDRERIERDTHAQISKAKEQAKQMLHDAEIHAEDRKKRFHDEQEEFTRQLDQMERVLEVKKNSLQRREARVQGIKDSIEQAEQEARRMRDEADALHAKSAEMLMQRTGITREQALQNLMRDAEDGFAKNSELRLQRAFEWAQERSVREARNILSEVIYKYASSTKEFDEEQDVIVPKDEMKGRIVGRGAANIACFEELFEVDVVFNDEPNIIKLSCFNLVNREIARVALTRLLREKVVNEDVIHKAKVDAEEEVAKNLLKIGRKVLHRLDVPALQNVPDEFARLVGRLRFRTSYGQNVLRHSLEVGYFARLIAGEVGADPEIALLGGFFHDIGKAIDQEVGGSHDVLSKEILEKYGFSWEITHAAWTHHNAIPQETVEARVVQAADAISASRPGARAESLERYMERMKDLQEMALSFDGIKKAYAINAGREVRAFVDAERVADTALEPLAVDIAKKVEEKGGYPGRIKITTIRSTKVTNKIKI
ncbi:hypothetical protein COV82_06135 [Candidatus Peregrinibacteria bacterium CG11_big_fil_rev_8_21_14_0_20_46_8]|nr:MAG: hypothetical protein COV82_06135 [Candidatus Peregrinibacteria bacterium CG11_big_fil_rev_8_21_14_0_20_46_8]